MNIHEHQAKELLKKFGVPVPNGVVAFSVEEVLEKSKLLKTNKYVLKAQIHAGGRGKAGGIKILNNLDDLEKESSNLLGKFLKTQQTGPEGREVKRLYIEEATEIDKEFYLSCLIDRTNSKIAFIASAQGGMDIEEVALKNPNKIITHRLDYKNKISDEEIEKVVSIFNLKNSSKNQAQKIIQSIYQTLIKTDASLIEINPLAITKKGNVLCLDAKINFDDNGLYRHPEILNLRDLSEEDPIEIEASKHDLSYIKLNGKIGCMVNGAGLAMATMDIIKLHGGEPANFLDVGGGATTESVYEALTLISKMSKVKGILVNLYGGIVKTTVVAEAFLKAYENNLMMDLPVFSRMKGTESEKAIEMLQKTKAKIYNSVEEAINAAVMGVKK